MFGAVVGLVSAGGEAGEAEGEAEGLCCGDACEDCWVVEAAALDPVSTGGALTASAAGEKIDVTREVFAPFTVVTAGIYPTDLFLNFPSIDS